MAKKTIEQVENKEISTFAAIKAIGFNAFTHASSIKTLFKNSFILGLLIGSCLGYAGIPVEIKVFPQKNDGSIIQKIENIIPVKNDFVSFIKDISKDLAGDEKTRLIDCYTTVIDRDYDEGYEIRENLRDIILIEFTAQNEQIKTFGEQAAKRIEEMNINDSVTEIKKVYKDIIKGLQQ